MAEAAQHTAGPQAAAQAGMFGAQLQAMNACWANWAQGGAWGWTAPWPSMNPAWTGPMPYPGVMGPPMVMPPPCMPYTPMAGPLPAGCQPATGYTLTVPALPVTAEPTAAAAGAAADAAAHPASKPAAACDNAASGCEQADGFDFSKRRRTSSGAVTPCRRSLDSCQSESDAIELALMGFEMPEPYGALPELSELEAEFSDVEHDLEELIQLPDECLAAAAADAVCASPSPSHLSAGTVVCGSPVSGPRRQMSLTRNGSLAPTATAFDAPAAGDSDVPTTRSGALFRKAAGTPMAPGAAAPVASAPSAAPAPRKPGMLTIKKTGSKAQQKGSKCSKSLSLSMGAGVQKHSGSRRICGPGLPSFKAAFAAAAAQLPSKPQAFTLPSDILSLSVDVAASDLSLGSPRSINQLTPLDPLAADIMDEPGEGGSSLFDAVVDDGFDLIDALLV